MLKKLLFVIVTILFLLSALPLRQAWGQTATISVQPPTVFGLTIGLTFQINITVSDVTNLAAWQCNLYFQPAVLSTPYYFSTEDNQYYANVTEGPFLQTGAPGQTYFQANFFPAPSKYNDTYDLISLSEARLTIPPSGISGSGTVATINFTVIGQGPSILHLDPQGFFPTKLIDPDANLIPYALADGQAYAGTVDVAIGEIETLTNIPKGSMALINVTAQNRGTPTETFDVTLTENGNPIGTQSIVNLNGGNSQILNFAWDTTLVPMGEYTLTATATKVPGQSDISDLSLSVKVYVGIRNVAVTGITCKTSIPAELNGTSVAVDVQNVGQATETFNVTLSANSQLVGTQTITLAPGGTGTIYFLWNTTTLGYGNYTLQAYIPPLPYQTDTTDNNRTLHAIVTIPGDLNNDFKVSLSDLVILATAYQSRPGNANWNINADINGNLKVDLPDLVLMAIHYGQHTP